MNSRHIERSVRTSFSFLQRPDIGMHLFLNQKCILTQRFKASLRLVRSRTRSNVHLDFVAYLKREERKAQVAWCAVARCLDLGYQNFYLLFERSDVLSPSLRGLRLMRTALSCLCVSDALSRYGPMRLSMLHTNESC